MICVSIGNVSIDECISAIKSHEMAEVRIDLMNVTLDEIKKIFSSGPNIIATCRAENKLSDEERITKLEAAIQGGAAYVDVEVDSSDYFKSKMTKMVKDNKRKLIISYHNREKTPSRVELEHIVKWCKDSAPDVIKIACTSYSNKDNVRLMSLLDNDDAMIVIGMGEKGRVTRYVAPLLGAFCTFVGLSQLKQTAHGQPTEQELKDFFKGLKITS